MSAVKLASTASKPAAASVKSLATQPSGAAAQAQAAPQPDEPVRQQRQPYVPKTSPEYEAHITRLNDELLRMKKQLYPTSNSKPALDNVPTRRQFDELATGYRSTIRDYKTVSRQAEQKPRRKAAANPDAKTRTGGFKNPNVITPKLAAFVARNYNTKEIEVVNPQLPISSRALMTSVMTQYGYDKNLRNPEAPMMIVPNDELLELFKDDFAVAGVNSAGFPHTDMQKLITKHVSSAAEFREFVANNPSINLEEHKVRLEAIQDYFKAKKNQRAVTRPKPKPRKPKAGEEQQAAAAAQ